MNGLLRELARCARQLLQRRLVLNQMSVRRDNRRYIEPLRRYNAREYDPGCGWETLISNMRTRKIDDSHVACYVGME